MKKIDICLGSFAPKKLKSEKEQDRWAGENALMLDRFLGYTYNVSFDCGMDMGFGSSHSTNTYSGMAKDVNPLIKELESGECLKKFRKFHKQDKRNQRRNG